MCIRKFVNSKTNLSKSLPACVLLLMLWIFIFLLLENDINERTIYGYRNYPHLSSKRFLQNSKADTQNLVLPLQDKASLNSQHNLNKRSAPNTETYYEDSTSENVYTNRLPKAIIIGVKKCGTRALLEYLRLNPSIRAPGPEPHFFDRYYHLGLNWYRSKMPKSQIDQITIEKTPRYFVKDVVPERVYNMSKFTKLIVVVRDPVVRAISDFTQAVSKHVYSSDMTFRMKALRHNGDVNQRWAAISTGLYAQHLQNWLKYFDLDNIHFVDGENLVQDPVGELNNVEDFLGLNRVINSSMIYFNETRGFPCIRRNNGSAKCFRRSKGRHHMAVDKNTLSLLYKYYSPNNDLFYKITKTDFGWGENVTP